jgi:hypothetical protein
VISQTDIAVYKNSTLLTLTTNYTVTISSANGTGSVTLVVAATNADQITIVGARTIQRTTDFVTAGDLSAASLNEQLDGEIIMIQQIAEENKRTLKAPVYDLEAVEDGGALNMVLPVAATRATKVLAFDATGNPVSSTLTITALESQAAAAAASATAAASSASASASSASASSTSATNSSNSATSSASSAASSASSAASAAATLASGLYSAVQDKSANYTVVLADAGDLLRVTTTAGAVTITLPEISTVVDGFKIAIVKWSADANGVTIARSGSNTINGTTSASIGSQYTQTTFIADFETDQWFASTSGLGSTNVVVDAFNGTGSQTAFTLSSDPITENNTYVYVSGVYQSKATYSVSSTTLTFSTAPPSGTGNVEVVFTQPLSIGVPSDGTVTAAKIATNAVTTAKILDANVTLAKLSATGTPSASTFLRGDDTWATVGLETGEILTSIAASKTGYLLCNGAAYTRTSYATLAAAIGTPIAPVNTLGNALTGYNTSHRIYEANGVLFRTGSGTQVTTATVANGMATSADGITWTLRTGCNLFSYYTGNQVSFGASLYVMHASFIATNTWQYQTTPDNVTFTSRSYSLGATNTSAYLYEIAYGGTSNRHVAFINWNPQTAISCGTQISTNVRAIYSVDGITWTVGDTVTLASASVSYSTGGIASYSGGFVYYAYRSDGTNLVKHSVDGATWTDITANIASVAAINTVLTGISYANGRFILTAFNNTSLTNQIYTSTTGASGSWTQISNAVSTVGSLGRVRGNSNAYVANAGTSLNTAGTGTAVFSTDLLNWVPAPNLGLGNIFIFATPSSGTRFYGSLTSGAVGAYLCDIYSYTTSTQFVVPKLNTYATGTQSSPYHTNAITINYLIKT